MTRLSIIIVNYNTKELIGKCISALEKQYKNQFHESVFEIFVVDNASTDGSVSFLESLSAKFKDLTVIENNENIGFAKGCNRGAKHAKGEYLFFLNSDTVVGDSGLLRMAEFLDEHKDAAVLGGKLKNQDGSKQNSAGVFYHLPQTLLMLLGLERGGLLRSSPDHVVSVNWVSGASMMVRADVFEELHGFDEHFFMYMEDMELCFRVKKKGLKVYFFPDIEIVHLNQGSSNRAFAIVQIYKGLLYFYKKHKSALEYAIVKTALVLKALIAICIGILTKKRYLVDTYRKALAF